MPTPLTTTAISEIVDQIAFNDWRFRVGVDADLTAFGSTPWLQITASGRCNVTGDALAWHGRKWRLSRWMTKSEIVQTAFKAVLTAVEHEAREQFRYLGRAIFEPHLDVDQLVALVDSGRAEDVREVA